jgi:molybdopterin-guanine dinucleotide biosynthesis protein A
LEDFLLSGAGSFDLTITSIVLAGGRSSRLGREKLAEVIAGKSLIERAISSLSSLSREIFIVISQKQARSSLSLYTYPGAQTVVDLYPGKGSLIGIYTGLMHSTNFLNLAVACDMPFLNLNLLRYMVEVAPGFDVVIPKTGDQLEPLHAVYSKNCAGPMKNQIEQGNLKITGFFDLVKVRYVGKEEMDRFDPERLSFFNINTDADLKKARMLAAKETTSKNRASQRKGGK